MHQLIKEACAEHLRNQGYTVRPDRDVPGVYYVEDGLHEALLFVRDATPSMFLRYGLKESWGCPLIKWVSPHVANPDLLDSLLRAVEEFFRRQYRVESRKKINQMNSR